MFDRYQHIICNVLICIIALYSIRIINVQIHNILDLNREKFFVATDYKKIGVIRIYANVGLQMRKKSADPLWRDCFLPIY